MSEVSYKPTDSSDEYSYTGCRLAFDPEVKNTKHGLLVKFKIVSTSRNKGKNDIEDLWVEVQPADFHVEAASFLRKGDVLHRVRGKPVFRRFGAHKEMTSFVIERAQLDIPSELKAKLRERGWSGFSSQGGQGRNSTNTYSASAGRSSRREIEELPED